MGKLGSILRMIGNYKKYAALNVLFNILSAIFSLFSIAMIFPFLRILFRTKEELSAVQKADFSFSINGLNDWFNYELGLRVMENKTQALVFLCVIVVVLFFVKNLCRYLAMYFLSYLRNGVVRDLRQKLFKKVLRLPVSFFSEKRKGDVISRMTSDVQEVEWSIMNTLEVIFREPVLIILYLGALILISPQLTVFVLLMLLVVGVLIGYVSRTLRKVSAKGQEKLGIILSVIDESLSGLRIIHAFNAEKYQHQKFSKENDQHFSIITKLLRRRDLASPLSEFLGICVITVVLWFGGRLVLNDESSLSPETFIGYIAIFSQLINPAKFFTTAYYNIQKGLASVDRIKVILDAEETINEIQNAVSIQEFKSEIEYKNVSFAYESNPVLQNIDVRISKGKMIALVGQSGAGKSTLVDLLPRFYDASDGAILIDGVDIRNYKLKDLRGLMGVVTQEPILFNDTIHNNITFGLTAATKDDVMQAAKIANAHEFIVNTSNGYETIIGDRGHKLSGGERQRLTIARAVLKNPPILILDEATSSLDSESEKLVQDAISKLMLNRTSIVIAHRLSTIQSADEIIVLQKGKIVERGNHKELMNQNGYYRRLVEMQGF